MVIVKVLKNCIIHMSIVNSFMDTYKKDMLKVYIVQKLFPSGFHVSFLKRLSRTQHILITTSFCKQYFNFSYHFLSHTNIVVIYAKLCIYSILFSFFFYLWIF